MEAIKQNLSTTLPDLSPEVLGVLLDKLKQVGVQSVADLIFVENDDLKDVLLPIQARKLLKAWKRSETTLENLSRRSSGSGSSNTELVTSDTDSSSQSSPTSRVEWLLQFDIPWTHFPKGVTVACKEGKQPDPLLQNEMKRVLVDEILQVAKHTPTKREMESIAFKMVSKYLKSFQDSVGGQHLGRGYESLANVLYNRSN